MTMLRNIYDLPTDNISSEIFDILAKGDVIIERILSTGQTTPSEQWYDQETDEWVILLQGTATILFEETGEIQMNSGDYILIKAHEKHQVTYTSMEPPCIWLAVHGNLTLNV